MVYCWTESPCLCSCVQNLLQYGNETHTLLTSAQDCSQAMVCRDVPSGCIDSGAPLSPGLPVPPYLPPHLNTGCNSALPFMTPSSVKLLLPHKCCHGVCLQATKTNMIRIGKRILWFRINSIISISQNQVWPAAAASLSTAADFSLCGRAATEINVTALAGNKINSGDHLDSPELVLG